MSTPINIVGGIRSERHTPKGTQFVNLHEDFRTKVNKVFASQPLDQGGSTLNSLGPPKPPRYFGLSMVHPCRPTLPPSKPYR